MAENSIPTALIPDEILNGSRQSLESLAARHTPASGFPAAEVAPVVPKNMSAIEDLLLFGSLKHEATILGMRFTVRTLRTVDREDAYGAVAHLNATSFVHFSNLRDELLARAVERVNGLPLAHYYRPDSTDPSDLSDTEKSVRVIKKMYGPIVDKLYELYNILEEKSAKALSEVTFDDLKNS